MTLNLNILTTLRHLAQSLGGNSIKYRNAIPVLNNPEIECRELTPEEEHWHLTQTAVGGLDIWEKHGYSSELPSWIQNSVTSDRPSNEIGSVLLNDPTVLEKIKNEKTFDYSSTKNMLKELPVLVDSCWPTFKKWNSEGWFDIPDKYLVLLTRWGLAGSYLSSNNGSPWDNNIHVSFLKAATEEVQSNLNYRKTIPIHEIIHLGIERTIIQPYEISQNQKERIVDFLCLAALKNTGYWIQARGDDSIDSFMHKYLTGNSSSLRVDIEAFYRSRKTLYPKSA